MRPRKMRYDEFKCGCAGETAEPRHKTNIIPQRRQMFTTQDIISIEHRNYPPMVLV